MLQFLPARIGTSLRNVRAGADALMMHAIALGGAEPDIELRSPTFRDGCRLPAKYTADGAGISPPLRWSGIPAATASLALVIEDADSPTPHPVVHAIAWDLRNGKLPEGVLSDPRRRSDGPKMGRNSLLMTRYLAPDPPPGHGPHRYVFQLFALDRRPAFARAPGRSELEKTMHGHVLASGSITATYERPGGAAKRR